MTDRDPHFIGWLPMPRTYARFLTPLAVGLLVGAALVAGLIAWGQRSPGVGRWEADSTIFEGIAYAEPYAMIRVPSAEPGGPPRTLLLVEEGKFGASDRVRLYDGQPVRVSGTLLSRGDRLMLELAAGNEGLRPAVLPVSEQGPLRRSPPRSRGPVSLRGEIVDSKCHLGAMKPGGGRTHQGCAVLCLKGGVPPLFIPRHASDTAYLLTNADGGPLASRFFVFAGESIGLHGIGEDWDDLPVLKVTGATP